MPEEINYAQAMSTFGYDNMFAADRYDREKAWEVLDEMGAVRVECEYTGGHDEGWVETIHVFDIDGTLIADLHDGYTGFKMERDEVGNTRWVDSESLSEKPDDEAHDIRLARALCAPVYDEFGSFDSTPSVDGKVEWDVRARTVVLSGTQDRPTEFRKEV